MLRKYSVSMMVLLVAASSIGISSVHQYVEGQGPRATQLPQRLDAAGTLAVVRLIDSPAGKVCNAVLDISESGPGGLPPGTSIDLVAPNEHWCTIFVLSKLVSKGGIAFEAQNIKVTSLPPTIRTALLLSPNDPVYRITYLDIV